MFETRHVGQILGSACRALVLEQLRPTEHRQQEAVHDSLDATGPRLLEVDPADLRQQVDPTWRKADLIDVARSFEVGGRHPMLLDGSTKGAQRAHDAFGVLVGWAHETVEVAGRAWDAVHR